MNALSKTILSATTIAVVACGCGGGGGHGHHGHAHGPVVIPDEVTLSAKAMQQHKLTLGAVKLQSLRPTFEAPARVAFDAETMAHVGTLVKGRVREMRAHIGDTVQRGDVLFTIESPELGGAQNAFLQALDALAAARPALELAQNGAVVAKAEAEAKAAQAMLALATHPAAVAQAQGALDAAKPVLERATELLASGKQLAEDGAIATAELKRREAAVQTATAEVQAAEAKLAGARAQQVRDIAAAKARAEAATAGHTAAVAMRKRSLGEAQSALQTAEAGVATARNQLTLLGMDDDAIAVLAKDRALSPHFTVRAPRDGTVVEREVTLGEIANPSQPHLLVLADLAKVWVLIELPAQRARGLKAGHAVTLVDKAADLRIETTLAYVSPLVDPESRTVQARVELDNPTGQWRPGQFLSVQLPTGAPPEDALVLPAGAVQIVDGQPTVYKLTKKTRTFKAYPIEADTPVNDMVRVRSGLKAGEHVVVKGTFLLKAEFGKAGAGHDHSH